MHTMQRNYAFLTLLLMLAVLMGSLGGVSSSARTSGADEPASGGRPITPAGSLVQDVNTRQPAAGSLPVDFVRSPDQMGPDGGGRYLIMVIFASRRRHTRLVSDWSSDVCSSD